MVANRAYKFRIYPNDEQKILFAKTFGCVRMVYNHWLDRKIRQYEENKTNVTYTICAKEMAAMKTSCRLVSPNKTLDFTWVKSLGTVTYAIQTLLSQWAPNTDLLMLPVLNRQKQSSTV